MDVYVEWNAVDRTGGTEGKFPLSPGTYVIVVYG